MTQTIDHEQLAYFKEFELGLEAEGLRYAFRYEVEHLELHADDVIKQLVARGVSATYVAEQDSFALDVTDTDPESRDTVSILIEELAVLNDARSWQANGIGKGESNSIQTPFDFIGSVMTKSMAYIDPDQQAVTLAEAYDFAHIHGPAMLGFLSAEPTVQTASEKYAVKNAIRALGFHQKALDGRHILLGVHNNLKRTR